MIISGAEIRSALTAYKAVKRKAGVSTLAFDTADRFEQSDAASLLGSLGLTTLADPFYRPDLVEDLRRRISEGKYFVPAEDIVDKLLGRLLVEAAV